MFVSPPSLNPLVPDEPINISSLNLASSTINLPNEPVEVDEPLMFPPKVALPLPDDIVKAVVEPLLTLNSVPVASVSTPINQGCVRLPLVFLNSK